MKNLGDREIQELAQARREFNEWWNLFLVSSAPFPRSEDKAHRKTAWKAYRFAKGLEPEK